MFLQEMVIQAKLWPEPAKNNSTIYELVYNTRVRIVGTSQGWSREGVLPNFVHSWATSLVWLGREMWNETSQLTTWSKVYINDTMLSIDNEGHAAWKYSWRIANWSEFARPTTTNCATKLYSSIYIVCLYMMSPAKQFLHVMSLCMHLTRT